ncbi:MAG: hypothetical protein EA341_12025 [Mongoliibacter sp.]|uniref:hypothetical protein n=1 Tax=Mongoliibacter sp. TaxID=2022438 RepID=UPI0012F21FCC|nr:hypothetical protein [Mongoliibacter sp.]TVP47782.1 MAG: hypothetical protein EA341_12025 [Mongoliibacter sp.]
MKLTEKDIEKLHYHINAKHIEYIEIRDEILDHYQTALESQEEKSMEEVLKDLDQTFTIGFCRQAGRDYLSSLKKEYTIRYKQELFSLFTTKNLWITLLILAIAISIPSWIKNGGTLMHLLNIIVLSAMSIENWIISRSYPNKKHKHHYRSIDDKPIFAHTKADTPNGYALLHAITLILIMVPLLFIHGFYTDEMMKHPIVFEPPYLYATVIGVWFLLLLTIVRFRVKTTLSKPRFRQT